MASRPTSKPVLIVNPNAGGGAELAELEQWVRRNGSPELRVTRTAGDAARLARRAVESGAEWIISAGGDGTLHEIVNGLAPDFSAVLSLVPLGTGNDFARSLGVPATPSEALAALDGADVRAVDVIRTNGDASAHPGARYIINSATGGFGVKVEEKVSGRAKALLGSFAYLLAAAQSAPDAQDHRVVVTIDDGEEIAADTPNVVVANGRFVAGGNEVAPQAHLDDGMADLIIVTAQTLAERLKLAAQVGIGNHLESPDVIFRKARRVRVQSDPAMPFSLDGEADDGRQSIEFEVLPRVLRVLAPGPNQPPRDSTSRRA